MRIREGCAAQPSRQALAHLTRFCRLLRSHGLFIGLLETADAVRVTGIVDLPDRQTTVFLLGDGWGTGESGELARQMRRMHRRVRSFCERDGFPLRRRGRFVPI